MAGNNVYSFIDTFCAIVGPNGAVSLGPGAASAEEGISVAMTEEKNTMQIGADGEGQHSLHAGKSGMLTVRLLKTSPQNRALSLMYQLDTASSRTHGRNVITIRDNARGDTITARQVAFARFTELTWGKDAGMNVWTFQAIKIDQDLGDGLSAAA